MDLSLLQALERERVLEVLRRDKQLRTIEEDRIRRLKHDLQELRRKGAKSSLRQYGERTCARCQRPLGKLWNCGAVCGGCSHRICSRCRVTVGTTAWKCTVCYAFRDVKIRSGEWFLEEKSKKFPLKDRFETVGERLLKTYSVLSHIAIVPPTPPPQLDCPFLSKSGEFRSSKPLSGSTENLRLLNTNPIKKKSTSENDVRVNLLKVDQVRKGSLARVQKSLSDTDVSKHLKLFKVPSLPNLFKKNKDSDHESSSTGAEEETSFGSEYSGGNRGSCSSTSTDYGAFETLAVAGELELAVAYNSSSSCLEITVGGCRNLNHGDTGKKKKCNPYVKVHVRPEKHSKMKTSVKKNTSDPVYNEVLKYQIERPLLFGKRLEACVFHSGNLKRKVFLGEVLIPLDGWASKDSAIESFNWYPLCPKQAESPDGGAVESDPTEIHLRSKHHRQGELLPLSSLHLLQDMHLSVRHII